MWSHLDHLNALIVVPAVALVFLGAWLANQDSVTRSTTRASGRTLANQTGDWIERDLDNLGALLPAGQPALVAFVWGPTAGRLHFWTVSDTTAGAAPEQVVYERVTLPDGRYRLDRGRVTPTGVQRTASSPPTLRDVTVDLRDAAGAPTADPTAARAIYVRLVADPLVGRADVPHQWERTFRPLRLSLAAP